VADRDFDARAGQIGRIEHHGAGEVGEPAVHLGEEMADVEPHLAVRTVEVEGGGCGSGGGGDRQGGGGEQRDALHVIGSFHVTNGGGGFPVGGSHDRGARPPVTSVGCAAGAGRCVLQQGFAWP